MFASGYWSQGYWSQGYWPGASGTSETPPTDAPGKQVTWNCVDTGREWRALPMSDQVPAPKSLRKGVNWSRTYRFSFGDLDEFLQDVVPTIDSAVVSASPSGLTIGTPEVSGTRILCRISGGDEDQEYTVNCAIVTSDSDEFDVDGVLLVI